MFSSKVAFTSPVTGICTGWYIMAYTVSGKTVIQAKFYMVSSHNVRLVYFPQIHNLLVCPISPKQQLGCLIPGIPELKLPGVIPLQTKVSNVV